MTLEYADLDLAQKDRLIYDSINLMRSITETWGAERGMELWETIANTLGQDLKGAVFFSVITNQSYGDVALNLVNTHMAVPIIKAIRTATGMGLKEAKDVYNLVKNGSAQRIKVDTIEARRQLVTELRNAGCEAR